MLLLLPLLMGASCKKESNLSDNIDSISPESQKQMIDKNINGIDFRFYLLDENNKPSTVFNVGENFEFYFSFQNNTQDSIFVLSTIVNDNLFRVYSDNGKEINDYGRSWTGAWCLFSMQAIGFPLKNKEIAKLNVGWHNDYNSFNKYYPLCASYDNTTLPKGNYYTIIEPNFEYNNNKGKKETISISLKINFKIQ